MRKYLAGIFLLSTFLSGCTDQATSPNTIPNDSPVGKVQIRLVVETTGCKAGIQYAKNGIIKRMWEETSSEDTDMASRGDSYYLSAASTCGSYGSATVKIYKNSTLVASDSRVGPSSAKATFTY